MTYLNDRIGNLRHHLRRVLMRMLPRGIAHHTLIQLRSLGILTLLALMRVMTLTRDYIVRH